MTTMRLLWERRVDELADFQEFDVASIEGQLPTEGDHFRWSGRVYEVLGVFRWYETYGEVLDYGEVAATVRARVDGGADETGVPALRPRGPSPLEAGAEATPPSASRDIGEH